jgi:hypothetical protein
MAVSGATLLQLGSNLAIQPLASHLWHRPEQISSTLKVPAFNWKLALRNWPSFGCLRDSGRNWLTAATC